VAGREFQTAAFNRFAWDNTETDEKDDGGREQEQRVRVTSSLFVPSGPNEYGAVVRGSLILCQHMEEVSDSAYAYLVASRFVVAVLQRSSPYQL
jgi:hypothetical protein